MKNRLRLKAFNFLGSFGEEIRTKLDNICGKTAAYDVPEELFQKRTSRANRVLISWKAVNENNLTIDQLESFSGGVTVAFVNNDYFDEVNQNNPVFIELKNKLGSNDLVSSIITIRTEAGSSSSAVQREAFGKLINNTEVIFKGERVIINEHNYRDYAISKKCRGGQGNEKWDGFLYVSIRGGQQDTIETHSGEKLTIFNPACEFANEEVCIDLGLTVAYFCLLSINVDDLDENKRREYDEIFRDLRFVLENCLYDSEDYSGNLLAYIESHPSVRLVSGQLTDPIQIKKIEITDFLRDFQDPYSINFAHNEAVLKEKYYWDNAKGCLLSPARPTNIFWSFHLSNMMQQNDSLEEYFTHEEERYRRRQILFNTEN